MKQASYVLTDFLEDPDFIRWVKHPDETQDAYWQQFLDAHPDKKPVVEMARQYILIFAEQTGQQQPSAAQSELMRQYIQKHVQARKRRKSSYTIHPNRRNKLGLASYGSFDCPGNQHWFRRLLV